MITILPFVSLQFYLNQNELIQEGAGAWVARNNDDKQWIQIDLKKRTIITAVATQGRRGAREFVQDYYILYSDMDIPVQWAIVKDALGEPQVI